MSDLSAIDPETRLATLQPDTLLVGHDGSVGAAIAVEVAFELAARLDAPLALVRSWSITTAPRPADWTFGYVSPTADLQQAVLDALVADSEDCRRRFPDVAVSHVAFSGPPSRGLIELSAQARMLVVGSRGMGGFAELVLGSVSDQCVRYAHCPVLVVKNTRPA